MKGPERDLFRVYYDWGNHWKRLLPFREHAIFEDAVVAAHERAKLDMADPDPFELIITASSSGPVLYRIAWDGKPPLRVSPK